MRSLGVLLLVLGLAVPAWAAHPLQVEDLQRLSRLSDPQVSPDGSWVAFTVQRSDVARNRGFTNLYLVSSSGAQVCQLTFADKGMNARPRWSPDSRWIYFLSDRVDGTPQVFRLPTGGGEAQQISKASIGVDSYWLSPDGETLVFSSTVFPQCADVACNEKEHQARDDDLVKVRVATDLPIRRWDHWVDGKRSHIWTMPAAGGDPKDLTPGDVDSPIWSEAGSEEVAISPDGQEIAFSRFTGNEALHGNSELFTMPIQGGEATRITDNPAADSTPLYSPDGRFIAYAALLLPGLEEDHTHLFLYDRTTGSRTELAASFDRSVSSYCWSPDSTSLWITTDDAGEAPIYRLDVATQKLTRMYGPGFTAELQTAARFVIFSNSDFAHPAELFRLDLSPGAAPVRITHLNEELLKDIEMGEYSSFTYEGWNNEHVQAWLIKPPAFDPARRYPILLFMHGGPEMAWANLFHYRWNPQIFAAAGYVVIEPNFHGSSGFGLEFMHSIQGRWGGPPYEDLMKAVDVASTWSFTDSTRLAAAGASYGGYMANWVEGHTDRFRTIVSHAGVFELLGSLYCSDLVGDWEKELKGVPWGNQQILIDNSPSTFARNFKTPMLVIHGERDYRVDPSNALAMFQVLQAMRVPSKLVSFEDENHWVLKPANSIFWYRTVLEWLDHWIKPDLSEYLEMLKSEAPRG
jgi:dipeptidyl aminopeptidase/acylaminoacyl peptidase